METKSILQGGCKVKREDSLSSVRQHLCHHAFRCALIVHDRSTQMQKCTVGYAVFRWVVNRNIFADILLRVRCHRETYHSDVRVQEKTCASLQEEFVCVKNETHTCSVSLSSLFFFIFFPLYDFFTYYLTFTKVKL